MLGGSNSIRMVRRVYLSGRTKYVSIWGVPSEILAVICGEVQGSFLSPLVFLLVINDIVIIGDKNGTAVIYIYADYTCIRLSLTGPGQVGCGHGARDRQHEQS